MHLNSYRMSLEWSRIEPVEGQFDEKEIEHYRDVLKELKKNNIKVCLTLHHNSHPVWFHQLGAFKTMDNLDYFLRYVEKVVPEYDEYVECWLILNGGRTLSSNIQLKKALICFSIMLRHIKCH